MMNGIQRVATAVAVAPPSSTHDRDTPGLRPTTRQALQQLEQTMLAFEHGVRWHDADDPSAYHRAVLTVHQLMLALRECESVGMDIEDLRRLAEPVRRVYARAPFAHRLQVWPRGYPGDFETIDMLLDGVNRVPATDFAHHLERYALWCAAAQQHRNKVAYQASLSRQAIVRDRRAHVLSIACGGSRDLATLGDLAPSFEGAIVLNDADRDALALSRERLAMFGDRCCARQGNAVDVRTLTAGAGPFALVLAGGLFDYLPDAIAARLIRTVMRDLVAPGGGFFFTNIATGNPYRLWMAVVGSWTLIERSESDLRSLMERAGVSQEGLELSRDTTGLAWFIHLRRPR